MRIFMIECDAEELRANRTVMDNITEALSSFTRTFAGFDVNRDSVAAAMSKINEEAQTNDPDEEAADDQQ